jgi:hypothetical protein
MATPDFRSSSRPSTIDDILTLIPKVSFVFLEGFDDAVVGVGRTVTGALGVVYDRNKMVSILARDGYGPLMANKWIDDNVGNIDLGPHTPIIFDNVASI